MSIRLRLTVLYSAILALTLIAFGGLLYLVQSQSTLRLFRTDLAHTAQRTALAVAHGRPLGDAPFVPREDRPGFQVGEMDLREFRARDRIYVLDGTGAPLDHPLNQIDQALPLSARGLEWLRAGRSWVETAQLEEERWLIYDEPVVVNGRLVAIVQVGRSLADRDRALAALGAALIVGGVSTMLIAFGVGWALAGYTLRPIHRITQTAHAIGEARDLAQRVRYQGPNDEVGQLATTFNAMLTRLEEAYQQIARSLHAQRRFVADVSHELRTPLTTIRGNLALLYRVPPLPAHERDEVLDDLVSESERLIRLVNDLLIVARADAGTPLECEALAVGPVVEDVCRQGATLAPGRALICEAPPGLLALANRDALKQVLLALVDNAIVHTSGAVRIAAAQDGDVVSIQVADDGPGMPPDVCARVFDRFYRAGEARGAPGFGLGLSIAKGLVEAQGGTIAIESGVETGSTFTVTLHAPQAPGEDAA
ncbi:MAG: HAMP domain-containing histidine kinase [Anaerolineae bacterium]|nr:HAMP domain-containing histidine kinase [Anaerolineae bacterium]